MKQKMLQCGEISSGISEGELDDAYSQHDVDMVLRPLDVQLALRYRPVTTDLHQKLLDAGGESDEGVDKLALLVTRWAMQVNSGISGSFNHGLESGEIIQAHDHMYGLLQESLANNEVSSGEQPVFLETEPDILSTESPEPEDAAAISHVASMSEVEASKNLNAIEIREPERQGDDNSERANEIERQSKLIWEMKEALGKAESECNGLQLEKNGLLKVISEMEEKRSMQKKWLLEKSNAINEMAEYIKDMEERLAEQSESINKLHLKYEEDRGELEKVVITKNSDLKSKCKELKDVHEDYQGIINQLNGDLQEAKNSNSKIEQDLNEVSMKYKEQLQEKDKELEEKNRLIQEQEQSIKNGIELAESMDLDKSSQMLFNQELLEEKEQQISRLLLSLSASEKQILLLRGVIKNKRVLENSP
ncbi:hypothetical protein [Endozoicomonas sp. Mp262]|uniref:hypothetical protein n=1 Tax=Endozoicomonas sp. Mp262 TaxID=2919499 RepID=UPI0021DFB6FA